MKISNHHENVKEKTMMKMKNRISLTKTRRINKKNIKKNNLCYL